MAVGVGGVVGCFSFNLLSSLPEARCVCETGPARSETLREETISSKTILPLNYFTTTVSHLAPRLDQKPGALGCQAFFFPEHFFFLDICVFFRHMQINIAVGAPMRLPAGGRCCLRRTHAGALGEASRSLPGDPPHPPHPPAPIQLLPQRPLQPTPPAVVEVRILPPTQHGALMALNAAALFPECLRRR